MVAWCCGVGALWAQADGTDLRQALTYKFALTDYNSLDPTYRLDKSGRFFHLEDLNYVAELGYHRYWNASVSTGVVLRVGSIDAYHSVYDEADPLCQPCHERRRNELFVGLDLLGQYYFANGYLLPERYWLAPYLLLGVGVAYMDERRGRWDAQLPMGLGLNIHLSPRLALQIQAEYRLSLAVQKHNLALSAGLYWQLGQFAATE